MDVADAEAKAARVVHRGGGGGAHDLPPGATNEVDGYAGCSDDEDLDSFDLDALTQGLTHKAPGSGAEAVAGDAGDADAEREEARCDELEALESILGDELVVEDTHVVAFHFDAAEMLRREVGTEYKEAVDEGVVMDAPKQFDSFPVEMRFFVPNNYPDATPAFELNTGGLFNGRQDPEAAAEDPNFIQATREGKKTLIASIESAARERRGTPCVFELVETARHACEQVASARLNPPLPSPPQPPASAAAEEAKSVPDVMPVGRPVIAEPQKARQRSPLDYVDSLVTLLRSMSDVEGINVRSVENILREDHAIRFEERCEHIREVRGEAEARVITAFHGTAERNVESIVRKGLLVPGTDGVRVATGSRFGVGIYVSPDPRLSLMYSRGSGRLLICAVVPGRSHVCSTSIWGGGRMRGYDSHISSDGQQIVLFRKSQVLPCFVVHYDCTALRSVEYLRVSAGGTLLRAKGLGGGIELRDAAHAESMRQAMKDARLKNGAYFFRGRFKVLDVADVDDDDDETPASLMAARTVGVGRECTAAGGAGGRPGRSVRWFDGPVDGEVEGGEYQHARYDAPMHARAGRRDGHYW